MLTWYYRGPSVRYYRTAEYRIWKVERTGGICTVRTPYRNRLRERVPCGLDAAYTVGDMMDISVVHIPIKREFGDAQSNYNVD